MKLDDLNEENADVLQRHSLNYNTKSHDFENMLDFTLSQSGNNTELFNGSSGDVLQTIPNEIQLYIDDKNIDKECSYVSIKNYLTNKSLQYDLTYRSAWLLIEQAYSMKFSILKTRVVKIFSPGTNYIVSLVG